MVRSHLQAVEARALTAAVAAVLAACSGGCLSSFVGPDGADDVPRYHPAGYSPEIGMDLSVVSAVPPTRGGDFWGDFASETSRITRDLTLRPDTNPLIVGASAETQPGFEPVILANEGLVDGEDSRMALARDGRRELLRVVRRALNSALRRQELYHEAREVLSIALGGSPITRIEPGPVLESPAVDNSYGASRFFPGSPIHGRISSPSPGDVDTDVNLGMNPRLGLRWMRLYRFSYEPRAQEMVHRLEYDLGGVGVGAAYRIQGGAATDVGVGLRVPVGRMSVVTLSAGRALHGAEVGEDGEPVGQSLMAEWVCRF
jgi:hypothetical protein